MTKDSITPLILRRTYLHDRGRIFDAFANASALGQWFSPGPDIGTDVVEFDFRVGGCYRITFTLPDGSESSVRGAFLRIERPTRLHFAWCWEKPDPHAGIETLVKIDFIEMTGATEVIVSHEKLRDEEMKERHSDGWAGALQRLYVWIESIITDQKLEKLPCRCQ